MLNLSQIGISTIYLAAMRQATIVWSKTVSSELHGMSRQMSRRVCPAYRRRIETEAKVKVFASVWGAKFIKYLAALAVLQWLI